MKMSTFVFINLYFRNFYEELRFDALIDDQLNLYLIEVGYVLMLITYLNKAADSIITGTDISWISSGVTVKR